MRCRAFYRVSFWVVLVKFVKAVLSLATARMGPTDLKNWAAKNYGGVLIKSPW
jgi:hypothetical protein